MSMLILVRIRSLLAFQINIRSSFSAVARIPENHTLSGSLDLLDHRRLRKILDTHISRKLLDSTSFTLLQRSVLCQVTIHLYLIQL